MPGFVATTFRTKSFVAGPLRARYKPIEGIIGDMIHNDHVQSDASEKIDAQIARAGARIGLLYDHENQSELAYRPSLLLGRADHFGSADSM
jgi:hypothetical protein